ncbi:MAG: hypothetical protein M9924_00770 [Rhizobiaceae bacterium]|nr:hypothetical protein [Rhizobiaceae bacterium]
MSGAGYVERFAFGIEPDCGVLLVDKEAVLAVYIDFEKLLAATAEMGRPVISDLLEVRGSLPVTGGYSLV